MVRFYLLQMKLGKLRFEDIPEKWRYKVALEANKE